MSKGNTCIAGPNLEVSPLIWISKGLVWFLLLNLKKKNDVSSDGSFLKSYDSK